MYIRQAATHTKSQYKHREIVETILQRKLTSNEVVHHIDNNPTNNNPNNLLVCSQKYHMGLHARERIQALGFNHRTHSHCSFCKTCHPNEFFNKSKNTWNGLHNMCRQSNSLFRQGKGYSKFTWKEKMMQQFRRANIKGLVTCVDNSGRCL